MVYSIIDCFSLSHSPADWTRSIKGGMGGGVLTVSESQIEYGFDTHKKRRTTNKISIFFFEQLYYVVHSLPSTLAETFDSIRVRFQRPEKVVNQPNKTIRHHNKETTTTGGANSLAGTDARAPSRLSRLMDREAKWQYEPSYCVPCPRINLLFFPSFHSRP